METGTRLNLNEAESTLARLLLDVAKFINPKNPSELRYTGGWVRDKLLGHGSHDIDVSINDMTGYQFGLRMKEYLDLPENGAKYGLRSNAKSQEGSGAQSRAIDKTMLLHGLHKIEANPEKSKHLETVTTKVFGLDIDLVNLRKETYTEDSRNPQMEFGTPEEDALRRDATINAMFYNLQTELVEDYTRKGMDDMAHKLVRTPLEPYQTFKDDPLRVLRLIRFASRLSYNIDRESVNAMKDETIKEALKLKISRERVGVELEKMLKGPDPYSACSLIDTLGLYHTIFTDPTKKPEYDAEVQMWRPSYDLVARLVRGIDFPVLHEILFPNADYEYTAWALSAFVPWFDAPSPLAPKMGAKIPPPIAVSVAREGIKATNKLCDVIASCIRNAEEISTLKDGFKVRKRQPNGAQDGDQDPRGRDTLGMAIRRWGATWLHQVTYSIMLEVTRSPHDADKICSDWADFLGYIKAIDLLAAYDLKTLVDGKELAKALNTKPGPWMREALDVVMAWQLRNPDTADREGAIEAVRNKQGELTAALARHFLQLTIRPLFAKTQTHRNVTAQGRKVMGGTQHLSKSLAMAENGGAVPLWQDEKHAQALELLKWVVDSLDDELAQQHWPLLIPPILTMLDDTKPRYKVLGCELMTRLLRATTPALLSRTGLGSVFQDAVEPSLTYLPTLTPEPDSINILNSAYPALLELGRVRFPLLARRKPSPDHVKFLSTLLHSHLLTSISHVSETYPLLTGALLVNVRAVVEELGIDTIPQLVHLLPLLTVLLSTPFVAAEPVVLLEATKTLQAIIANTWARMWFWHVEVLKGLCAGWIAATEEVERWKTVIAEGADSQGTEMLKQLWTVIQELKTAVNMLRSAVEAMNDAPVEEGRQRTAVDIDAVIVKLLEADPKLAGLLTR